MFYEVKNKYMNTLRRVKVQRVVNTLRNGAVRLSPGHTQASRGYVAMWV